MFNFFLTDIVEKLDVSQNLRLPKICRPEPHVDHA